MTSAPDLTAVAIEAAIMALGNDKWLRMAIITQSNVDVWKIAAKTAVEAAAPVLLAEHSEQIAREIETHSLQVEIGPAGTIIDADQVVQLVYELRRHYAAVARGGAS